MAYAYEIAGILRRLPRPRPGPGLVSRDYMQLNFREVGEQVQCRFMSAIFQYPVPSLTVLPIWHGTMRQATEGILSNGFSVPTSLTETRNGATHGLAVYGAHLDALWLSCRKEFVGDTERPADCDAVKQVHVVLAAVLMTDSAESH